MFIVFLRFSGNKAEAGRFMDGHNEWVSQGFKDGVFLLVGGLEPGAGGGIIAHNTTLPKLEARVSADPFVTANVVSAQIMEIAPAKADERLAFLLG